MAIYHLFNPVAGTAKITGTDTGVSETWVTAYTLSGVATTIPPITGNTNTGTVAAGVNSLSINLNGVPSGAWAAVNAMFANSAGLVGSSGTSGVGTSVNDTNQATTDVSVGWVTNMSAGALTLMATYTDTPGTVPLFYQWMAGVTNSGNYANLTNGGNISDVTDATWFLHS